MKNISKTHQAMCIWGVLLLWMETGLAAPVDLSSWTTEGSGSWSIQAGNNAVKQTINGEPTVFFNGVNSQGQALSGTIEVQITGDDDYIGFVLGYNAGDLTNSAASYLLIDWKQRNQNFFGLGKRGLAVSQVDGQLGDNSGAWSHDSANNVTEIQRATNLGDAGWADNTQYTFDLVFTPNLVQVSVNGVLELSINGVFSDGSFGFYNYSQSGVLYTGIDETTVVPLPAALPLFAGGFSLLGLIGWHRKSNSNS